MKSFFTGLKKSKIVEILSHNSIPQDLDRAFLRCQSIINQNAVENDEVWEIKQSDILKMKCQEKNDKNEELENDVAHVDVTHDHDGYKS